MTGPDVHLAAFVFNAGGSGLTFRTNDCNTNMTECQRQDPASGLLVRCGTQLGGGPPMCTFGPPLPQAGVPAPLACPIVQAACASNGAGSWSCSAGALRGAGPVLGAAGLQ